VRPGDPPIYDPIVNPAAFRPRFLRGCGLPERLFHTSFLLLIGVGYLMAVTFLYTSHAGIDGKPGLSLTDIAYDYYGNRSGTRLEAAIRGPMSGYLDADQATRIVAWLKGGAGRAAFEARVAPILNERCTMCHGPGSPVNLPDLTTYDAVHEVAQVDTGQSIMSLVRVSHIHLFGIGMLLFTVGLVFRMAEMRTWLKATLLVVPFAAVFVDIGAWFLTHWDSTFALTVVVAGAVLGLAIGTQILVCLYQMWGPGNRLAEVRAARRAEAEHAR
jgi:hypothetical protein